MHRTATMCFVAAAMLAAPAYSLAAGLNGFYINDPAQAKQADAVDASVQSADTLKPFDTQISNLNAFSKQEDLAVAGLYVSMRDKAVTDILNDQLAQAKVSPRQYNDAQIRKYVCQELNALIAAPPTFTYNANGLLEKSQFNNAAVRAASCPTIAGADRTALEALPGRLRVYIDVATGNSRIVGEARTAFEFEEALKSNAGPMIDDSCATLLKQYKDNIPSTIIGDTKLVILINQCRDIGDTVDPASPSGVMASLDQKWSGGELYHTYNEWQKALQTASKVIPEKDSPAFISALQTEKTAAEALAKNGDVATLQTFESSLSKLIAGEQSANAELSGLVKLQALQNVQAVLDCVGSGLSSDVSANNTPAAPAAAAPPSPPSCATAQAGVASETSSAAGAALAIAQLADIHDRRYRSANWISGANAIISAYEADAQIQTGAETLKASAAEARFRALTREASSLLEAQDDLESGAGKAGVASGDCEVSPLACALTHYVASWNSGRIPAEVLGNRALQLERVTQAQRWKNAMAGQRAVILAATASLRSYADGGLQPSVIAQVAFDLGLIAATAAR